MTTALTGERIRSVRQLLGISQVDLADAASVSQSLISQVENGTREASEELVQAVATATGTPRSFFDFMPPDIPIGTLRFRKLAAARQGAPRGSRHSLTRRSGLSANYLTTPTTQSLTCLWQ